MKGRGRFSKGGLSCAWGPALVLILPLFVAGLNEQSAWARDLSSAAATYTSEIKTIGRAMSLAGVVAGGICMQIPGLGQFGKSVMAGALVGALCSFGAPALVTLLNQIFGGG